MLGILLFCFVIFMLIGMPIAFAMGLSAFLALLAGDIPLVLVAQRLITSIDSSTLMAVPLFILAGELMNTGGITRRIIRFSNVLVRHIKGGLSHVTVVTSMVFASISGSSTAAAAAVGSVLIPAMRKEGYGDDVSASVTASASTMGPIIPPSITMIIYASITNLSIVKLFLAGVIPGILIGLSLLIVNYIYAVKRNYPRQKRADLHEAWSAFKGAFWALIAPFIIIIGITSGAFTPTEAGAVAVFYALLLGIFHRETTLKNFWVTLLNTGRKTATILIIIACASAFGWILTVEQLPVVLVDFLTSITQNPRISILLIIILLLFIGMFLEGLTAIMILVPVLAPLAATYGFDPIHFALIFLITIGIGGVTPPVGVLTFIACGVGNVPLKNLGRTIWIYVLAMLAVVLLVTYFPPLITYLPSLPK
ncbi:MAG: TRAP transporter large permease [Phycisphaerales bacterium]|nr:MAG: TRAP transporter large permease [Phycisphaerales bacterium]